MKSGVYILINETKSTDELLEVKIGCSKNIDNRIKQIKSSFRFNKETEISEVRIDEIAKFCGWTTIAKSGNECIRWNRVKEKLNLLGIANIGNGDFIKCNVARTPVTLVMGWIANILNKLKLMFDNNIK